MALLQRKNNAKSLTTDNPLTSGALSVSVTAGDGAKFPSSGDFLMTIWNSVAYLNPGEDPNSEIVRGTARSTDTITIVRAQEGTTATAHVQGSTIAMLITAGSFADSLVGYSTISTVSSGTYNVTESDYIIFVSVSSTLTLPTAVGLNGKKYNIIRTGTSNVIINTTSSQTISGDLTLTLTSQWDSVVIVSNGSNWIRCS